MTGLLDLSTGLQSFFFKPMDLLSENHTMENETSRHQNAENRTIGRAANVLL